MAISDRPDIVGDYQSRLEALLKTEADMGEASALASDLSDALSHFPEHVEIGDAYVVVAGARVDETQWMSFREFCIALQSWREQRAVLERTWRALTPEQQALVDRPPENSGPDVTRAWL